MNVFAMIHGVAIMSWVGGMVLATTIVTPAVFKVLSPDEANRFLGTFFPRYYLFGTLCGGIAVVTLLIMLTGRHFLPGSLVREAAVGLMLLTTVYAGFCIHPKIRALKHVMQSETAAASEKVAAQNAFVRLHQHSVRLNAVTLLVGLGMAVWLVRHGR